MSSIYFLHELIVLSIYYLYWKIYMKIGGVFAWFMLRFFPDHEAALINLGGLLK